ncbi:MAG TPA: hypothetical protein VNT52_18850, partial [Acidimicrobiales bacterium]|nr:hypothetical protein [Acidimicrobiales bacterium]
MRAQKLLVLDQTEDLSVQIEGVCTALRPRPTVVWCESFDSLEATIGDAGPFDVLVAGPIALKAGGFQRLRELRLRAPETQLLLALTHWRSSDLRETVRAGALDILRLPVADGALLEAIEQAIETGAALRTTRGADQLEEKEKSGPGTVIAVVSASGGSGKTFFATNLSYH